jgi:hypothetical protein
MSEHNPNCKPSDKELIWLCHECGGHESAIALLEASEAWIKLYDRGTYNAEAYDALTAALAKSPLEKGSTRDLQDFIQFHHNPIVAQLNEEKKHLASKLLRVAKELREACAACFRVICDHGAIDAVEAELKRIGIKDGFGKRAQDTIAEVENGL